MPATRWVTRLYLRNFALCSKAPLRNNWRWNMSIEVRWRAGALLRQLMQCQPPSLHPGHPEDHTARRMVPTAVGGSALARPENRACKLVALDENWVSEETPVMR